VAQRLGNDTKLPTAEEAVQAVADQTAETDTGGARTAACPSSSSNSNTTSTSSNSNSGSIPIGDTSRICTPALATGKAATICEGSKRGRSASNEPDIDVEALDVVSSYFLLNDEGDHMIWRADAVSVHAQSFKRLFSKAIAGFFSDDLLDAYEAIARLGSPPTGSPIYVVGSSGFISYVQEVARDPEKATRVAEKCKRRMPYLANCTLAFFVNHQVHWMMVHCRIENNIMVELIVEESHYKYAIPHIQSFVYLMGVVSVEASDGPQLPVPVQVKVTPQADGFSCGAFVALKIHMLHLNGCVDNSSITVERVVKFKHEMAFALLHDDNATDEGKALLVELVKLFSTLTSDH
jgi:hypothetical protein